MNSKIIKNIDEAVILMLGAAQIALSDNYLETTQALIERAKSLSELREQILEKKTR